MKATGAFPKEVPTYIKEGGDLETEEVTHSLHAAITTHHQSVKNVGLLAIEANIVDFFLITDDISQQM